MGVFVNLILLRERQRVCVCVCQMSHVTKPSESH